MGSLLLKNIREKYWNEAAGFFTSGPTGSESHENQYWESSGQEIAIWPRFGIVNQEQRQQVLDRLPEVAMNEFGVNVFPYRKETNHFCNSAWVAWTAEKVKLKFTSTETRTIRRFAERVLKIT